MKMRLSDKRTSTKSGIMGVSKGNGTNAIEINMITNAFVIWFSHLIRRGKSGHFVWKLEWKVLVEM